MNDKTKELIFKIVRTVLLTVFAVIMIAPILWMISSSFKFEADVFSMPMVWIPKYFNINNYTTALTKFPYFKWYLNTAKSTFFVVALTLSLSSMSGYAFAKLKFRGSNVIFALFISTLMIPMQVRIIPQFMLFRTFDMIDTHYTVILPWAYNGFAIFLMRQFFMSVPDELIEAAKIDGANEYRTFWQIVLPLAKPSLMALMVLSFTWGWNAYFGPLIYLNSADKWLLSVGVASFKSTYSDNYATQMAGATLALIPIIIVYTIAQKYFVEGIAISGIKG